MFNDKSPKAELPLVPLSDEEKYFLQTVYGTRLRYLIGVYGIMVFWAALTALRYSDFSKGFSSSVIVGILFVMFVAATGVVVYFKRIYSYRRDLKLGQKEVVSYTIIRKTYFPMTDEYFFSFDNPDYMHYKVDADLYISMNEGDMINIYRGKYSRQVFEKDARFTFM